MKQFASKIDELGWFGNVVNIARVNMATDISIIDGVPVKIGILKNYKPIEPFIIPSSKEIVDLISLTAPSYLKVENLFKNDFDGAHGDFTYEYGFSVEGFGRFRVSASMSEEGIGMSLRKLPYRIPSLDELDKYQFLKGVKDILNFSVAPPSGLILHTGITGSGKSTMIASEVDYIAQKISGNILIFENPIEYQITMRKATIRHYEVGRHIKSFLSGMKISLRNDPSVIMIGEVRTKDEIQSLFEVASKGHLVFSTLHTPNVMNTLTFLDEIGDSKGSWRQIVANVIRAIVSQRLMYRTNKDGEAEFILVAEVFIPNKVARTLMAEGKWGELETMIDSNQLQSNGTISFKKTTEVLMADGKLNDRERQEIIGAKK
jgi:twitching motility protein PilT